MTNVSSINGGSPARTAIERAKAEIAEENLQKGVAKLKVKYRELAAAQTVVANITREIADLEAAVEQGNV